MKPEEIRKISKRLRSKGSEMRKSAYASDYKLLLDAADAIDELLESVLELALSGAKKSKDWHYSPPSEYPNPYKQ